MSAFRSILFAGDFSEAAAQAFRVACSLASEGEARLIVLHVLEVVHIVEEPIDPDLATSLCSPYDRGHGSYHGAVKERLRRAYDPGRSIGVEYVVRDGSPAEEIVRLADEAGCDLIILGTRGRTGLVRLLAGSVAESVLRHARCPVMALQASAVGPAEGRDEIILHPTDFSECSRAALRVARSIARERGARLVILHALSLQTTMFGTIPADLDVHAVRDALDAMARGAGGPDLKHPVAALLTQGDAATEIARVAGEEPGCTLIVMGTHGRGGPAHLLMGSVAESVLRKSGRPVLAVKSPSGDADPEVAVRIPGGVAV